MAYSEAPDIIAEFRNIKGMQQSATYYHYRKGGIRAAQFLFHQGEELARGRCLLSYVCSRLMFDFKAVISLCRNNDSTPYTKKYPRADYQLEMFTERRLFKSRQKQ
mgnify:CR=1 FL=1